MSHNFYGGQWVVAREEIIQPSRHPEDADIHLASKGERLKIGYCTDHKIEVCTRRNYLVSFEVKPDQIVAADMEGE